MKNENEYPENEESKKQADQVNDDDEETEFENPDVDTGCGT